MRILLAPSAYYPSLGGVEELTSKLAQTYVKTGHQVCVVTNRWPFNQIRKEKVDGIPVLRIPFRLPERNLSSLIRLVTLGWLSLIDLLVLVLLFRPDIVHVVCCSSNLAYMSLLSRVLSIPLIVTSQGEIGMDAAGLYESDSYIPRHFSKLLKTAAWVTACSANTRTEVLDYSKTTRCSVIHNGIDIEEFRLRHDNPRLATRRTYVFAMGRHVHQKGFDVLIRAWHQLQLQDYDLVIGGSGTDTELIRDLIRDHQLESSVHLIGRLDRVGVVSHLQHAACFVLPSRQEPFGIVVLEAMAARTPVIATDVGGVPEFVIDGVNGRLVPGDDVSSLALTLEDYVINGVSEEQLNAGYATAVTHDWSTIAWDYLDIYSSCIAGEVQV
jgi:glycogen(starch) synthase